MKKTTIIIGVIIIILIIIAVSSGSSKKTATEPVRIGAALMLTGPTAQLGELQNNAINLALEKINKEGGINGRPLEVVVEDAAYDPKTAVSAYQALKAKGLHNFIIDGSSVVASTHQLVIDDGNFSIAGVATAPSYFDDNNHTCRIGATAKTMAPALAKLALKEGYKKVAMLMPDNEYGRGFAEEFSKSFQASNVMVVATEFYSAAAGTNDFRTSITKIKSVQPTIDAIVFSQVFTNVETMLNQMKTLGINKPILSDYPTATNPSLKNLSLMEGTRYVDAEYTKTDLPTDNADTKAFKDAYRAKYASDPIYFAAAHYDITLLLAKAIKEVGEDPQKISDYVSNLKNYPGITGTYTFDRDCEVDRKMVIKKIENGKIVTTD